MSAGLQLIYQDHAITIERIVTSEFTRSFDDFVSNTCFHTNDSERTRNVAADHGGVFYLFPRDSDHDQTHYIFGHLCLASHNSLFIDSNNQSVDKWKVVEQFPTLWDFFSNHSFQQATSMYPAIFWHVPQNQHSTAMFDIKNLLVDLSKQEQLANWDYDLHHDIVAQWEEDDWQMAYRLSQATCRSLENRLQDIMQSYAAVLTVDNIDIKTYRRRSVRKIVSQRLMHDTLISKLLEGMKMTQDPRLPITEFAIMNRVIENIDNILDQAIQQHLGK